MATVGAISLRISIDGVDEALALLFRVEDLLRCMVWSDWEKRLRYRCGSCGSPRGDDWTCRYCGASIYDEMEVSMTEEKVRSRPNEAMVHEYLRGVEISDEEREKLLEQARFLDKMPTPTPEELSMSLEELARHWDVPTEDPGP